MLLMPSLSKASTLLQRSRRICNAIERTMLVESGEATSPQLAARTGDFPSNGWWRTRTKMEVPAVCSALLVLCSRWGISRASESDKSFHTAPHRDLCQVAANDVLSSRRQSGFTKALVDSALAPSFPFRVVTKV